MRKLLFILVVTLAQAFYKLSEACSRICYQLDKLAGALDELPDYKTDNEQPAEEAVLGI